jgi:2'-5' RNA ligase
MPVASDCVRCFVALWPPPEVVDALGRLARPAADGLGWSGRDQWHVTLRFFGELAPGDVAQATTALVGAAASLPASAEVHGGPASRLLGTALVVWPVQGLDGIARAIAQETAGIGQPVPERPFVGHLTLARARRGTDLRSARHLLQPVSMSWSATSFSLVQSQLGGPQGAHYRDIETFPLGRSQG